MKVKELKKILEKVDENRIVIMQKDEEGNGYSPLDGISDEENYKANSAWSGEVGYEKLTPELKKAGYGEDDTLEGEPACILFPMN
jgi:glucose dehydrogenase